MELAENTQPVKLAVGEDAGDVGTVAGWGATYTAQSYVEPVLRWIELVISYRRVLKTIHGTNK